MIRFVLRGDRIDCTITGNHDKALMSIMQKQDTTIAQVLADAIVLHSAQVLPLKQHRELFPIEPPKDPK